MAGELLDAVNGDVPNQERCEDRPTDHSSGHGMGNGGKTRWEAKHHNGIESFLAPLCGLPELGEGAKAVRYCRRAAPA